MLFYFLHPPCTPSILTVLSTTNSLHSLAPPTFTSKEDWTIHYLSGLRLSSLTWLTQLNSSTFPEGKDELQGFFNPRLCKLNYYEITGTQHWQPKANRAHLFYWEVGHFLLPCTFIGDHTKKCTQGLCRVYIWNQNIFRRVRSFSFCFGCKF